MDTNSFRSMALSFPGTIESPHFDRTAFKVEHKRIYATLLAESLTANLKLSLEDQSVFCDLDKKIIYAVANKWGLQGWTTFELKHIAEGLMLDALQAAYLEVFKKKKGYRR